MKLISLFVILLAGFFFMVARQCSLVAIFV